MNMMPGQSLRIPLSLPVDSKELMMLWMPPGDFMMGESITKPEWIEEGSQPFKATISRGYWLGQYPVTQAQWESVMEHNRVVAR